MSLFSVDMLCDPELGGCGHEWIDYIEREERDRRDFPCASCNGNWGCRVFRHMNFMSTERHYSKAELKSQNPLKEAAKLEVKAANMKSGSEEHKEIKKEIKKLKSIDGPKS